jgi:signal transduction histidine kinase
MVEAVARSLGGLALMSVGVPGAREHRTTLISGNGEPAHHPPTNGTGRNGHGHGHGHGHRAAAWPRNERFAAGDLSRLLHSLPPSVLPPLRGVRRGALGVMPLHGPSSAAGLLLVYRPEKAFDQEERGLLRAASRQVEQILELRDAAERTKAALESRDEFLGVASHELASPLATASLLAGAVEQALTNKSVDLDDQTRTALRMTRVQLDRASAMVRRLAEAARRARRAPEPQPTDMDLVELVDNVVEQLRLRDPRSAGNIEVLHEQPSLRGHWDRAQLEEVLENLIGNALKFGSGRPVQVSLEEVRDGVVLRVRDHGIGINRADQARIFRRFVRAVPHRQFPGMGIGLWLVKQIVTSHGGHITVSSEPGQGSEFVVWLPRPTGARARAKGGGS